MYQTGAAQLRGDGCLACVMGLEATGLPLYGLWLVWRWAGRIEALFPMLLTLSLGQLLCCWPVLMRDFECMCEASSRFVRYRCDVAFYV